MLDVMDRQMNKLTHVLVDLKKIGELDDTLIVVTADHGHGFVRPLPGPAIGLLIHIPTGRIRWC